MYLTATNSFIKKQILSNPNIIDMAAIKIMIMIMTEVFNKLIFNMMPNLKIIPNNHWMWIWELWIYQDKWHSTQCSKKIKKLSKKSHRWNIKLKQ